MGKRKKRIVAHVTDGHGVVDIVWFNGTKYIYQNYLINKEYIIFGKPNYFNGRFQFTHPDIDDAGQLQLNDMGLQPFYITTERMKKAGITSRAVERMTKMLISKLTEPLEETLPPFITSHLHLISRDAAMRKIHYPKSVDDTQRARVRLKFEELFYVQLISSVMPATIDASTEAISSIALEHSLIGSTPITCLLNLLEHRKE